MTEWLLRSLDEDMGEGAAAQGAGDDAGEGEEALASVAEQGEEDAQAGLEGAAETDAAAAAGAGAEDDEGPSLPVLDEDYEHDHRVRAGAWPR
jgi:hypothetical protein